GLDIDLDLGDMAGVGVSEGVGAPVDIALETRLEACREAVARRALENTRELGELDRKLGCADDTHLAILELEVVLSTFEDVARKLLGLAGYHARGKQHGGSGRYHLAARKRTKPERDARGVTRHHADLIGAQSQLIGSDLRERGLQALADRGRACED